MNKNVLAVAGVSEKKEGKIPKKIHYIWIGRKPKPQSVYDCIKSWKKSCPDYEIIEWNEDNFDISENKYALEAYQAKKFAFVTDYMRLSILKKEGGIYVDSDLEIIKNLDEFLNYDCFSGFENAITIPTACFGAKKDCKYVNYLLSYYDDRSFYLKNGKMDLTTNVITISAMTYSKYGIKFNNELQVLELDGEKIAYYPFHYFCAKDYVTGKVNVLEDTYSIHHFKGSWLENKNKRQDKLVEKIYKFLGEKNFRKVMKMYLLRNVKKYAKKIDKKK